MTDARVTLVNGDWLCVLDPARGGAILSLRMGGADLLRPAPADPADMLDMACFPLLPFANRIERGCFSFSGRSVRLAPDPAAPPHAHHGHGWRRPWTILGKGPDWVDLALEVMADDWPWSYRARQHIRLDGHALRIELAITNEASTAMPAGMGIHPYFVRTPDSRLVATATALWMNDGDGIARVRVGDHRFDGTDVPVATLEGTDNFFEGAADVVIRGGPAALRLSGEQCAGFHVYVPAGADYFCVEPVSHAPNSFARGHIGTDDIIAPGGTSRWQASVALADSC